MSKAAGQELVRQLARESDVVIENFKVGTLSAMGSISKAFGRSTHASSTVR